MPHDKNIFSEQSRLEKLSKKVFITNIIFMVIAALVGISGFLFMVWATIILLRLMEVLP